MSIEPDLTCIIADCAAIRLDQFDRCLAHLGETDLNEFLRKLESRSYLELRGTTISSDLLNRMLEAVSRSAGQWNFDECTFPEPVELNDVTFTELDLTNAVFHADVRFSRSTFHGDLSILATELHGHVRADEATFTVGCTLDFHLPGSMMELSYSNFSASSHITVKGARFANLESTVFQQRAQIRAEVGALALDGARFEDGATIVNRGNTRTSLHKVHFASPSTLSGGRVSTLAETDVSNLTLAEVDLGNCLFAAAHHLDELRLEGHNPFSRPPSGVHSGWAWPPVWWWTSRRVVAEERIWRRKQRKSAGWEDHRADAVTPERVSALYRSLRKAFEDNKNEPGAGDFYYGEMEMRRHAPSTSRAEKVILGLYWAISGYGQRASRALAAVTLLVAVLTTSLIGWGVPENAPTPAPGTVQVVQLPKDRWTGDRLNKSLRLALGSVVFRDADQKLTDAGAWTVMAGRAIGPVLLALAALAIRARVKR
ncbi:pentapeptide repeat-containing protein [Lentzea tibetensis]|uniref:Pentapeptide repeat-containing protein n=1 Tax=Lentzea tibetensis TaxID=2591470 RepID=A0A563EWZ9_9PSEU|nr:pentapeptide repeat-containing protein [Lentzea tibetensis]TWP52183.1 pentapeptide repeat-containing protein [Lentzea tibetensis]